jgi:TM2 domain-containing membrane protein YozV
MSTTPADAQMSYPALPLPAAAPAVFTAPKTPVVALVLSLFPGIGQIYNGQPAKALVFFFAWAGSIYMTAEAHPFFAFLIAFTYFYNLVDAWRSAVAINARHARGAVVEEDTTESPAWGAALIGVGALLLLNNVGWLRLAALQRYWPLVLMAAGGAFLYSSTRRAKREAGGDGGA